MPITILQLQPQPQPQLQLQYTTVHYSTLQYITVQYLYYTILYYTILYYTTIYYIIQHTTILYYIIIDSDTHAPSTDRCLWKEKHLLREPLPCNTAAETALQPLMWCFEHIYSRGFHHPEKCFLTDTGNMPWYLIQKLLPLTGELSDSFYTE